MRKAKPLRTISRVEDLTQKPKSQHLAKKFDVTSISRLDRVIAPKQARSEQRLQDIVQALDKLLQRKPFDKITIPEIAVEAGCGTGSIYGRFQDKNSILVALNEANRKKQLERVDSMVPMEFPESTPISEICLHICRNLVAYYSTHKNLARASHILGEAAIYERVASMIQQVSRRLAKVISRPADVDPAAFDRRIDLAAQSIYALMQQRMMYYPISSGRYATTSDEGLAREMATAIMLFAGHKVDRDFLD